MMQCVIPKLGVLQAEGGILRGSHRGCAAAREIPRPAGESAGLRDDAFVGEFRRRASVPVNPSGKDHSRNEVEESALLMHHDLHRHGSGKLNSKSLDSAIEFLGESNRFARDDRCCSESGLSVQCPEPCRPNGAIISEGTPEM